MCRWSNVFDRISVDDTFSLGAVMGMFIADTCLYFTVAWYVLPARCMSTCDVCR